MRIQKWVRETPSYNHKNDLQAIKVSSRVFSLAQLYYSDECKSTELSEETNETTNQISDSKME